MNIGLIVVDDGIYTHRWVRQFLDDGNHTICAGACLSPFSARNFNPRNGHTRAILARIRYYGLQAAWKFGWRYLIGMVKDEWFRFSGCGRAGSVRTILSMKGVPLISIPDQDVNNREFQARLKVHEPDVLLCTFSQKAGEALRKLAPLGCLNIHFSCLPENAGREPVFWSLLRGRGFGLTVYRMGAKLDAGQMLAQESLDAAGLHSLHAAVQKVCRHVPGALCAALHRLEVGGWVGMPPYPRLNSWPETRHIQSFHRAGFRFI